MKGWLSCFELATETKVAIVPLPPTPSTVTTKFLFVVLFSRLPPHWFIFRETTGLARKIVTLLASILIYGHEVNALQCVGLTIAVGAMIVNFLDKGKKKGELGGLSMAYS